MRGYGQYCPIARGAEIFATRWTPIIVRNLLLGARTFGELLEGAPGIPRSVLSERLGQLERAGVLTRVPNPHGRGRRYEPTEAGRDLRPVCEALGTWGAAWVETTREHLDPYVALWALCRGLGMLEAPARRLSVRFDLTDAPRGRRRFWLLVQAPTPEVCVAHPGYDEDVVLRCGCAWLVDWVQGATDLRSGVRGERVTVEGPRELVAAVAERVDAAAAAVLRWGEPAVTADTGR